MSSLVTVSLVRTGTTRDQYGNETDTTSVVEVPHCLFAPRASEERVNASEPAVISGATIYFRGAGSPVPASTDVIALPPGTFDDAGNPIPGAEIVDGEVKYNGPAYLVEGEPGPWPGGGVEVAVRRWSQS